MAPAGSGVRQIPAELAEALRGARCVAVLTGAGMSAESGLRTFRDAGGLWSTFNPDDLGTVQAFRRDPCRVWAWYAERRRAMSTAVPNAGHLALADMERHIPDWVLATQNIDGLHLRAGSRNVLELHGNILGVRCLEEDTWVDPTVLEGEQAARAATAGEPPRCPRCGSYVRPDVVWFGEALPEAALAAAFAAARRCDVFLSIGTSGVVEPAASLPYAARRSGAIVAEVNVASTVLTVDADITVRGPAGVVLPLLLAAAWPPSSPAAEASARAI